MIQYFANPKLFITILLFFIGHIVSNASSKHNTPQPEFYIIKPNSKLCPEAGVRVKASYVDEKLQTESNLNDVANIISNVEKHASSYPPHFKNKKERECIEAELELAIKILKVESSKSDNTNIALNYAWCLSMGHNLDFPGSADKAISVFNNILNKDPDNSRANYLYGGFLASTKLQAKSIPFLQKAIKLGIKEANYSLFSVYASQNKISEAITHLEEYLKHYPSKEYTELLHTLKSGNFKIKNVIVD